MNLLEILSPKEHQLLIEKLGNLAKLGMPKLIQTLKQSVYKNSKNGPRIEANPQKGEKDNKFKQDWNSIIGAGSEIIDVGIIKKGISDLRKFYKVNETARAFGLYIDGKPVAFGKFDSYDIGHQSRDGVLAYDLSAFKSKIDEFDDNAINAKTTDWEKRNYQRTNVTTIKSTNEQNYNFKTSEYDSYVEHRTGEITTTKELQNFIELCMTIGTVSCKLVLRESLDKRKARLANQPVTVKNINEFRADLMTRLKKYKLSKKPSVDNIQDFLKSAEKGTGIVQFAGSSYSLTKKNSYSQLSPIDILNGKSFYVNYESVDPNSFNSVTVTYSFDKETSLLMPLTVSWKERDSEGKYHNREEILNKPTWLKQNKIDPGNKTEAIKNLLLAFKSEQFDKIETKIKVLRSEGVDWPELKTIEKSIEAEKAKNKNKV